MTDKFTHTDIDLNFVPHPITKDIGRLTENDAIKRSAKNLLLTNYFESFFNSQKGTPLRGLLFENITAMTELTLKRAIELVLSQYEPRMIFQNVVVNAEPEKHYITITIFYTIKNKTTLEQFDVILKRTR